MSSIRAWVGDVYCVRWLEPELVDVEAILREVRAGVAERSAVHYLAFIGETTRMPAPAVRQAMKESVEQLLAEVRTVHIVVEGRGFRRAALRSINTAIFLASRHRDRAFAHDSARAGVEALARWEVSPDGLMAGLASEGLVSSS